MADPVIVSNGGGANASISIDENSKAITFVLANDDDFDPITYSIDGGADALLFEIDGSTGHLRFIAAPDFEHPQDTDTDNVYEVVVKAFDGTNFATQTISVTVANLVEPATGDNGDNEFFATDNFDAFDGLGGIDTVNYSNSSFAVGANLGDSGANFGNATGDTYLSIENLVGSAFNDKLTGDAKNNKISGGNGTDNINGDGGDDVLLGQQGSDTLKGGNDSDLLDGGSENDTINGGAGADTLIGGIGSDTLDYQDGIGGVTVSLARQAAFDTNGQIVLPSGKVKADFEQHGGDAEGDLAGGFENLRGGSGNDTLTGDAGANNISGLNGDDTIEGGLGDDVLSGGGNIDTASYAHATGAVTVNLATGIATGADGKDTLSQFENIIGSKNNDVLIGANNFATTHLIGGDGNDRLVAGRSDNLLEGGLGNDIYEFAFDDFSSKAEIVGFEAGTGIGDVIRVMDTYVDFNTLMSNATDVGSDTVIKFDFFDALTIVGVTTSQLKADDFAFNLNRPVITSNGGALAAAITLAENTTVVTTVKATDANKDTITYSIVGGIDQNDFTINAQTGLLQFKAGVGDFELPQDSNTDNVYNVIVRATDGGRFEDQSLIVNVTNLTRETLTGTDGSNNWIAGADAETFNGLLGSDAVSYGNSTAGVSVNLATGKVSGGFATGDRLNSVESAFGTSFNDILVGDKGDNSLFGGGGDDLIDGGLGNDQLNGGGGTDRVTYAAMTANITADLFNASYLNGQVLETDSLNLSFQQFVGGKGNDTINGFEWMEGGLGDDIIKNDIFLFTNATASYEGATAGVTVSLAIATKQDTKGAGKDTLTKIDNLFGSAKNDTLTGDGGDNKIDGSGGNDTLAGGGGVNELYGGTGNDLFMGGAGTDAFFGQDGALLSEVGIDTVSYASSGAAVTVSLSGKGTGGDAEGDSYQQIENVIGSNFDDIFVADGYANKFEGGAGIDTVSYALSQPVMVTVNLATGKGGLAGNTNGDTYISIENVIGDWTDDLLIGNSVANKLEGGDGNDFLVGALGSDTLIGGNGIDTVSFADITTSVSIVLAGGAGSAAYLNNKIGETDTLSGIENLIGGKGNDSLTGDININKIEGGAGNDTVEGGGEADELHGGLGIDTLSYAGDTTGVKVQLDDDGDVVFTQDGDADGDTGSGFENIRGGSGNDFLAGNKLANTLEGGGGDDWLHGGARSGNDVYNGGSNTAAGDTVSFDGVAVGVTVNLMLATAQAVGKGLGSDKFIDVENLIGTGFDDKLTGNASNNALDGGDGKDTLTGGAGADILTGGLGNDTFVYAAIAQGGDTIMDFAAGDKIQIDKSGFAIPATVAIGGTALNDFANEYFTASGAATKAHGQFVYDTVNHTLSWDTDGSGVGAATLIATFANDYVLNANDFILIA